MELVERLAEKITSLELELHAANINVGQYEIKLNILRRGRNRLKSEIKVCKDDLVKLQESKQ